MIVVNTPGSWQDNFSPLMHANYDGFTLADAIFPAFIFMMGLSIALSFNHAFVFPHQKVIKRTLLLALIGLVLNIIPFSWQNISLMITPEKWRFFGVLQRLAFIYCITAYMSFSLNNKSLVISAFAILTAYGLMLLYLPFPFDSEPKLTGNLAHGQSLVAYVDSLVLAPLHLLYKNTLYPYDPEGILSTLPGITTALIGVVVGRFLMHSKSHISQYAQTFILAIIFLFGAYVLKPLFPFNKTIYSPSFTLLTIAISLFVLTFCIYLEGFKGIKKEKSVVSLMGRYSLELYVGSILLSKLFSMFEVRQMIYQTLLCWLTHAKLASLIYSLLFLSCCVFLLKNWLVFKFYMSKRKKNDKAN